MSVAAPAPDQQLAQQQVPGRIRIADRVVAKLAARAAAEFDGVGAAAPRLLGQSLDGLGGDRLGRRTALDAVPKADATVDGESAFVSLVVSVRWPLSVPDICRRLRAHVTERVGQLSGLTVAEVDLHVDALVADLPDRRRVL